MFDSNSGFRASSHTVSDCFIKSISCTQNEVVLLTNTSEIYALVDDNFDLALKLNSEDLQNNVNQILIVQNLLDSMNTEVNILFKHGS